MVTLLSELVRVLSSAAARELRARADGPALSRAELMALATLSDLSAACCAAGPVPMGFDASVDLDALHGLAAFDLAIVERARAPTQA